MSDRLKTALCLLLLALVVAAFFWPLLLGGQWIPRGGGDLVSFLWPLYRFAARSLRAGELPLWNPHLYSGMPFLADNQSGLFYPLNLLVFFLLGEPSYGVMEGLVVFHIWLAGVTMFALIRELKLGRPAALLGGIAYALSDLFVTHIGNLNLNATAAWLPLLLLLSHRACTRRSIYWAASAGAVLTVAALAGHAQMLLFLVLALGVYLIYRLVVDRQQGWGHNARTLALVGLVAAIGVGGAALTLIPAYELAGHTGRGHLPFEEAARYSLPPKALIGLVAPGFFGRGADNFWGDWERVEAGYLGVATLVLALLGVQWWGGEKHPLLFFFIALVPFALLLAMGKFTPLYGLLYRLAPTFDRVRAPARLILLADLGLAALAAVGFDRLSRGENFRWARMVGMFALAAGALVLLLGQPAAQSIPPVDRRLQATNSVVMAAALLALSGLILIFARRARWTSWLLLPLVAAELLLTGSTVEVDPHDPTLGFQQTDVVDFLQGDLDLYRIESTAHAWQPDAALVFGLYDIGGIYNPLGLAPYEAYRWGVGERGDPLYNLLGTKYVLADKGQPPGDERLVPVYTANPGLDVYLNTAALPRALLAHRSQVVPDHAAAWDAIHAPDFDPAELVILEEGEPLAADPIPGGSEIFFQRYDLNRVELVVRTPAAGYLLLSDVFYPGWRATVDGELAEILRADYLFRALYLSPGEHVIKMAFAPHSWYLGLAVSVITWLGLVIAANRVWRRRKFFPAR